MPDCALQDPNDKAYTCRGTKIQVIGTPLAMSLEFKSNFACNEDAAFEAAVRLGDVDESFIHDEHVAGPDVQVRTEPVGRLEKEAVGIHPPRGGNVRAPVDDV